jgi:hypothetical protein
VQQGTRAAPNQTAGEKRLATEGDSVFLRIDKLQIELPRPAQADPESAGVVQELMGGKFGEMSTLINVPEYETT